MLKPSADYIRETEAANAAIAKEGRLRDLWDLLCRANRFFGARECIVEKRHGHTVSHTVHDLYNDVCALGAALQDEGFCGGHAVILGDNSYEWLVTFLALACSGSVAVPLDKELTREEIGEKVGLTRERVRQIKEKAIRKLRMCTKNKVLKTYLG